MLRFYTGDDLGNIKSIDCTHAGRSDSDSEDDTNSTWKLHETILQGNPAGDRASGVHKLIISSTSEDSVLAAARCNGSLSTYSVNDEGNLDMREEWKESRFRNGHTFVGLACDANSHLTWCTSNGALGRKSFDPTFSPNELKLQISSLPMRICAWKLSPSSESFAYGGNEVDLSVWDTELAFTGTGISQSSDEQSGGKKRKRGLELLPAETWRAKNIPNDALSLRQPIYITSLAYLSTSPTAHVHIATGTERGDVRRYDIRAANRPIANWRGVAKAGGVKTVEAGLHENELFVSDCGTNLFALDLRNGRTIYSYKKLVGAINCVVPIASSSPASGFLASTSHDRFFRLHSTFVPPASDKAQQDQRGKVLGDLYMRSTPTAVVYDSRLSVAIGGGMAEKDEEMSEGDYEDDDGNVWAEMRDVGDSDEDGTGRNRRTLKGKKLVH